MPSLCTNSNYNSNSKSSSDLCYNKGHWATTLKHVKDQRILWFPYVHVVSSTTATASATRLGRSLYICVKEVATATLSCHCPWFSVCRWLCSNSEKDLYELANCFASASKAFGLTVSIKKTEVLWQLAPNTTRCPPNITDGEALKNVLCFQVPGQLH